jgi:hypothetical protein
MFHLRPTCSVTAFFDCAFLRELQRAFAVYAVTHVSGSCTNRVCIFLNARFLIGRRLRAFLCIQACWLARRARAAPYQFVPDTGTDGAGGARIARISLDFGRLHNPIARIFLTCEHDLQ